MIDALAHFLFTPRDLSYFALWGACTLGVWVGRLLERRARRKAVRSRS